MTTIELTGMVGAGKSTVGRWTASDLSSHGYGVLDLREGLDLAIDRTLVGSVIRILTSASASQRRARTVLSKLLICPSLILIFTIRRPMLTWLVVRAVGRSPLPLWHRRMILWLFLHPAAAVPFIERRLINGEILLLEEGLAHRAVNLFAWAEGEIDQAAVEDYLARLRRPDVTVLVEAPIDVCVERARSRGLPLRLRDRDAAVVHRFMENAAAVVAVIAATLDRDVRSVIVVDNGADECSPARERLRQGLRAAGLRAPSSCSTQRSMGTTPLCEVEPRRALPRRLIDRGSRSTRPALADEAIDELLSAFELSMVDTPCAVPGESRADNAFVTTCRGPKLLKRYKSTVDRTVVEHEHAVLWHLASQGFASPRLDMTPDGLTSVEFGDRIFAVFDYAEGYFQFHQRIWRPSDRQKFVALSGRSLAALHRALIDLRPSPVHPLGFSSSDGPRVRELDWYLDGLRTLDGDAHFVEGPSDDRTRRLRSQMLQRHAEVEDRLRRLDDELRDADLPRQVIHGDYGPYNLLFRPRTPVMILDFEMARLDWRVLDLAKAIQQFALTRVGLAPHRLDQFMWAYRRSTTLERDELRMLPSAWRFLHLRRVITCWNQFGQTGQASWLEESQQKLALADVAIDHADSLTPTS